MTWLLLWMGLAGAQQLDEAVIRGVVVEVGSGLEVDWTEQVLRARASTRAHGTEDTKALEELARRELQVGMEQGAGRILLAQGETLGAALEGGSLGRALKSRVARWEVVEATYYASGRVGLVAELALQDLLKPWTLAHAQPVEPAERAPNYTGLVVDARGSGATPAWSPRVLADDGEELLYDGTLWEEVAVTHTPVLYVGDPAHPAATRAGERPMFVRAEQARGPDLILTREDTVRFRTSMARAEVLGRGTVVVVLAP